MLTISIMGFADRAAATKFFDQAKATAEVDAIFLDRGGRIQYSKELGNFKAVEAGEVFTVITFAPGTPIKLDTGTPAAAVAADADDEEPAADPADAPDAAAPDGITGPEI